MPERLDEEELADWRAGRYAIYPPAALTIGACLAVADAWGEHSLSYLLRSRFVQVKHKVIIAGICQTYFLLSFRRISDYSNDVDGVLVYF